MRYPHWVQRDLEEGLDPLGVYCTECGERFGDIEDYRQEDNSLPWYIEDESMMCDPCAVEEAK